MSSRVFFKGGTGGGGHVAPPDARNHMAPPLQTTENKQHRDKKQRQGSPGQPPPPGDHNLVTTQQGPVPTPAPKTCRDFAKGVCSRGTDCRFLHEGNTLPSMPQTVFAVPSSKVGGGAFNSISSPAVSDRSSSAGGKSARDDNACREFQQTGACKRGSSCKYRHIMPSSSSSKPIESSAASNSSLGAMFMEAPSNVKRPASEVEAVGGEKKAYMTTDEFKNLPIAVESKRALAEVMKYQFMTLVQSATLSSILSGKDCLAKAKTGTGKTLAFLIPAVELFKNDTADPSVISTLILSPTRELATQIGEEAKNLLTFHRNNNVVTFFGGTNINKDKRELSRHIAVLVATPGRMNDHLSNTPGFCSKFNKMRMLILDEADQLLEMGFKPEIDKIISFLPPASRRQTLLFSATVPQIVTEIARNTLKPGYTFIDTVGVEAEQTHLHVDQQVITVTNRDLVAAVYAILMEKRKIKNHKIIVFFTTARVTGFMADLFKTMNFDILQIHSRLSQSVRTKTSDNFRLGTDKIMFSSDVSARGMDYPDVTFVLQVGSTEKSQYIHRLGRTARAGKEGSGCLILCDFEENSMLRELKEMPLKRVPASAVLSDLSVLAVCTRAISGVERNKELKKSASHAYQAWLGYYNGKTKPFNWSKAKLVEEANGYARIIGLSEAPGLQKKTIGMMGLKGVPGLRIAERFEEEDN
jgi:ATP-dependent RNA helicase MSS116, mitochondrial